MLLSLPSYFKDYFWDVHFDKLDTKTHWFFIIERLIEVGSVSCLKWVKHQYKKSQILAVLFNSQEISRKTASFFVLNENLNREKIITLQKPFTPKSYDPNDTLWLHGPKPELEILKEKYQRRWQLGI